MFLPCTTSPASPGCLRAARRGLFTAFATAILLLLLAVPNLAAAAPVAVQYLTTPGGSLVVAGTSTLHNWTAKSTELSGDAALAGQWTGTGASAIRLQAIHLVIPVNSLKSSEGSGMDNTMYDALHLKRHAVIAYQLTKAVLKTAPADKSAAAIFSTTGTLTVNAVTKSIHLMLTVTPLAAGGISVATTSKLKMTDFGVKPPTAMFGVIRSGNAITITADWHLAVKAGK